MTRICGKCRKTWNVSVLHKPVRRYVCPLCAKKKQLAEALNQLESCGYVCEAGKLEMNEAFIALRKEVGNGF